MGNRFCISTLTITAVSALSQAIQEDLKILTNLSQAIQGDVTKLRDEISNMSSDITKLNLSQVHQEVLDWLSPLNFASRHADIMSRRQKGTGEWLIDSAEFQDWSSGRQRMLWCAGMRMDNRSFSVG